MKRVVLTVFDAGNEEPELTQSFEVCDEGVTSWMIYLLVIGAFGLSGIEVKK